MHLQRAPVGEVRERSPERLGLHGGGRGPRGGGARAASVHRSDPGVRPALSGAPSDVVEAERPTGRGEKQGPAGLGGPGARGLLLLLGNVGRVRRIEIQAQGLK